MLRDEVVDLIRSRAGGLRNKDALIMQEMGFVQRTQLEGNSWIPWFLESELSQAATTAGERRLPFPVDFLGEIEEQELMLVLPDGTELPFREKGNYDVLARKYPGTGMPVAYATVGEYFAFFPLPDQAYGIKTRYYARDVSMIAENVETKWLKHASDVVVAATGAAIAGKVLQNAALEASFKSDLAAAWDRLYERHVAMEEVNRTRTM